MTSIITVTLNAALDRTLLAPSFVAGRSQTAVAVIAHGGGKGINVARALPAAHLVVLSGSLPAGLLGDLYVTLIEQARAAGVPAILDTRGATHAGLKDDQAGLLSPSKACSPSPDAGS